MAYSSYLTEEILPEKYVMKRRVDRVLERRRKKAAYNLGPDDWGNNYGGQLTYLIKQQIGQMKQQPSKQPVKKATYTYTPSIQTTKQDNTYVSPVKVNDATINYLLGKRITNVPNPTNGGYKKDIGERISIHKDYDPTGGFISSAIGDNMAKGEEDQYWRAYLGLENDLPTMSPDAQTEWDYTIEKQKKERGEPLSDFYGITPRISANIEAMLDTLNLGKMVRNYDIYKQKEPSIPKKESLNFLYNQAVKILNNPEKWHQVNFDNNQIYNEYDNENFKNIYHEINPLGMFRRAGIKYSDKDNAIYVHDTYDFPKIFHPFVPKRPKEMKIRGKIDFNPLMGSFLLNDSLLNYNHLPLPKSSIEYYEEDY